MEPALRVDSTDLLISRDALAEAVSPSRDGGREAMKRAETVLIPCTLIMNDDELGQAKRRQRSRGPF